MSRAVLAVLCVVLPLSGCKRRELEAALAESQKKLLATQEALDQQKKGNAELRSENQSLQDRIAELEREIQQLSDQNDQLAKKAGATAQELAELRKEKAKREAELATYKQFLASLRALIEARTVKVTVRKGRLVLELASSILFDSGKTELKAEGEQALTSLAQALKTVKDREFLVAGHTDNVPIKTARFKSNWELSAERAVVVAKFLVDQAVPAKALGAAGFAEFDPVQDNRTEEGRSSNRRIEFVLMPKLGELPEIQELLK